MTRIEFHFNAPERLQYACRLMRKARARDLRLGVLGAFATLRQLDTALWSFSEVDFLPHCLGTEEMDMLASSPIVLGGDCALWGTRDVLLNLGDEVPAGFAQFERVIEIVSLDEHSRMCARQRWKHYVAQGYALIQHDVSKVGAS